MKEELIFGSVVAILVAVPLTVIVCFTYFAWLCAATTPLFGYQVINYLIALGVFLLGLRITWYVVLFEAGAVRGVIEKGKS
jgi:hypothetical protein